jgi:hypothetical protein
MFFIGSDAGRIYTSGKFDGRDHTDEAEMDRAGAPIECAGERPYMVPTEGWKKYIQSLVKQSIDAGAVAILPEEPLLIPVPDIAPPSSDLAREIWRRGGSRTSPGFSNFNSERHSSTGRRRAVYEQCAAEGVGVFFPYYAFTAPQVGYLRMGRSLALAKDWMGSSGVWTGRSPGR